MSEIDDLLDSGEAIFSEPAHKPRKPATVAPVEPEPVTEDTRQEEQAGGTPPGPGLSSAALADLRELIEIRTNALSDELAAIREDVQVLMTSGVEEEDALPIKPAPATAPSTPQETQAPREIPATGEGVIRLLVDPFLAASVAGAAVLCALSIGVGYGLMLSSHRLPAWGWSVLLAPSGLLLFPVSGGVLLWQAGGSKRLRNAGSALVALGVVLALLVFLS